MLIKKDYLEKAIPKQSLISQLNKFQCTFFIFQEIKFQLSFYIDLS